MVIAKPATPGPSIANIPSNINTMAVAMNQLLAFLVIIPPPLNLSDAIAAVIWHLHSLPRALMTSARGKL
jgi:hypothetical protein